MSILWLLDVSADLPALATLPVLSQLEIYIDIGTAMAASSWLALVLGCRPAAQLFRGGREAPQGRQARCRGSTAWPLLSLLLTRNGMSSF